MSLNIQIAQLDFLVGEPGVDVNRIGIWGTSYSGGHVIYVGAHDSRVAAIVSQVGYQGIGWSAERLRFAQQRATDKARGEIDPIPQGIDVSPNLRGTPDLGKMVGVDKATIYRWETGECKIAPARVKDLSNLIGVSKRALRPDIFG